MNKEGLIRHARKALTDVMDPQSGRNIVAAGLAADLAVSPAGVAKVTLRDHGLSPEAAARMAGAAEAALAAVDGVARAVVVSSAQAARQTTPPDGHDNPFGLKKPAKAAEKPILEDVKNVIAIASGKGGVGKSTVAANLAVALADAGYRTGLLDADIYGPSLPTLFGLADKPPIEDGLIVPPTAFGVTAMSIGLLVDPEQALAWRGPMVTGALKQLLNDVAWGALDYLLIDTPPGTGDAHLTLAQSKRLTGAVIVSTPQELALADVRRGVEFFRKVNVPILGVIENMAWLENDNGAPQFLFGEGGAEKAATAMNAPFLGAIPLDQALRESADAGEPILKRAAHGKSAAVFRRLAEAMRDALSAPNR